MTKITLCMITRDEAAFLPACLESAKDVADEIVIVDTGSQDDTVAIAKRAGAKVIQSPWTDDFSAPRNLAIESATGDWILVLDADERLAVNAAKDLRAALINATFDCGMLRLHDAASMQATVADAVAGRASQGPPLWVPRVLRNTGGLRFEGVVHETVDAWLSRRGRKLQQLPVDVVHFGQTPEMRLSRKKSERNIGLLRKRCEAEPDNPTPLGYLATELLFANQFAEAKEIVDRGWTALHKMDKIDISPYRLCVARARLMLTEGNADETIKSIELGEKLEGEAGDFWFLKGCALEIKGRRAFAQDPADTGFLQQALDAFRAAKSQNGLPSIGHFVQGGTSWQASTRIATILLHLQRPQDALSECDLVASDVFSADETALVRIEALVNLGRHEEALAEVEPTLKGDPDGWILAAQAAEGLGGLQDMRMFFDAACARNEKGYQAWHRAYNHVDMALLVSITTGRPLAGPGGLGTVCALMGRHPLAETWRLPNDRELSRAVDVAIRGDQSTLLDPLFERRAQSIVPGILDRLKKILSDRGIELQDDGEADPVFLIGDNAPATNDLGRLLAAHPDIDVCALPSSLGEMFKNAHLDADAIRKEIQTQTKSEKRTIWTIADSDNIDRIADIVPRARLLVVNGTANDNAGDRPSMLRIVSQESPPDEGNAHLECWRGRLLPVQAKELAAAPKETAERLLAFLGEAESRRNQRQAG